MKRWLSGTIHFDSVGRSGHVCDPAGRLHVALRALRRCAFSACKPRLPRHVISPARLFAELFLEALLDTGGARTTAFIPTYKRCVSCRTLRHWLPPRSCFPPHRRLRGTERRTTPISDRWNQPRTRIRTIAGISQDLENNVAPLRFVCIVFLRLAWSC